MEKKLTYHSLTVFILVIFNLQFSIFNSSAQLPNTWIQKANFPGVPRIGAVGFTIGTKGYVGTGQDSSLNLLSDFWEYDPSADAWTQRADFAGSARRGAVGFAIGSKGYIGTGFDGTDNLLDFWEYNPLLNAWVQKRSLGNSGTTPRRDATSFAMNNKGYVATGYDGTIQWNKECWQFDGDTTWIKEADMGPGGATERRWAVGFAIDSTGYVGCGFDYSQDWRNDFWKYNAGSNTWTQLADFGGTARANVVGFSMNGKGYIGTGADPDLKSDYWEYDPATNVWIRTADYGGGAIIGGIGFSINGSGYAGLGRDTIGYRNDFWQYTPDSTIGINELPLHDFDALVFPNPCGDKLYVKRFTIYGRFVSASVLNSDGEKCSAPFYVLKNNEVLEVNTTSLSPGIYFFVLNSGKEKIVKKFVKE